MRKITADAGFWQQFWHTSAAISTPTLPHQLEAFEQKWGQLAIVKEEGGGGYPNLERS